ncbi:hypothetical protein D6764_05380 [Candidatus Woesearchaeota archaeon]|nr:MAG: hypothetical protein D6764_05380 [Candidatus Woesearchaeota archaeon]
MKSRKWCLFDLHDTLVSNNIYMALYQPVITRLISEKGIGFSRLNSEIERLKGLSGKSRADTYDLCESFNALDIYYQELARQLERVKTRSDVAKLFDALNEMGKKIGIVSNSHVKTVRMVLEHHNLIDKVEFIFCREHGGSKDSLSFWNKLMKKHSLDPDDLLLIDNDEAAIENAQVLGIKTLKVAGPVGFSLIKYIT